MLRVTIELLPGGDKTNVKSIGVLEIENVGGTEALGDYRASLEIKYGLMQSRIDRCDIEGFDRSRGGFALVMEALDILGFGKAVAA